MIQLLSPGGYRPKKKFMMGALCGNMGWSGRGLVGELATFMRICPYLCCVLYGQLSWRASICAIDHLLTRSESGVIILHTQASAGVVITTSPLLRVKAVPPVTDGNDNCLRSIGRVPGENAVHEMRVVCVCVCGC